MLKPKKYFSMLLTTAKYVASSGFNALLALLMWAVINFESVDAKNQHTGI